MALDAPSSCEFSIPISLADSNSGISFLEPSHTMFLARPGRCLSSGGLVGDRYHVPHISLPCSQCSRRVNKGYFA